ncbi:hypothetical protein C8R43DRAFT_944929 [Mycena crocata]|nr:hypothetical protein C8R43DRAFT_944929 [Mycena crocata]
MDFNLPLARDRSIPIWSVNGNIKFCSIGGSPDDISPEITDYMDVPPTYPGIRALEATEEDPIDFVFDQEGVELIPEYIRIEGSSDSDGKGGTHLAGYFIAKSWTLNTVWISGRLNDIIMELVLKTDFYGPNAWSNRLADLPPQVNEAELDKIHWNENAAQTVAGNARRTILEQMAFSSWFSSIVPVWKHELSVDDRNFVDSLRLEERPKTGFIFSIEQDYHEMNNYHLMNHGIPFHFAWTAKEEVSARFRRYSPEFSEEYEVLKALNPGQPVDLHSLPSFKIPGPNGRSVDSISSRMGISAGGLPALRSATHRQPRGETGMRREVQSDCQMNSTGQNPIHLREPGDEAIYTEEHQFPIEWFGDENAVGVSEEEIFKESIFQVREWVKNRYAPRPDRLYNTYNGMLSGPNSSSSPWPQPAPQEGPSRSTPLRSDSGNADQGEVLSLRDRIGGVDLRLRAIMNVAEKPSGGGAASPWRQNVQEESDFEREQQRRRNFYTEGAVPSSFEAVPARESPARDPIFRGSFRTRNEAVEAIRFWSGPVVKLEATRIRKGPVWTWNRDWLSKAVLIDICDVQELAESELSSLDLATLYAFYEPGYVDAPLQYGAGGASAYFRYKAILNSLLKRPHAIAFIYKGGILSFIAQLYDEELIYRFLQGPSAQVLSFQKGAMTRTTDDTFLTSDQVTESEISLLLGHVVTGDAGTERTLWPHPDLVDEFCLHAHGVWTPGFWAMLNNLAKSIVKKRRYIWRKQSEWILYLINSGRGSFPPAARPTEEDYNEGTAMIERAFPLRWNYRCLSEITIPERFDPRNESS